MHPAVTVVLEKGHGHLGPAGVVDADEQHLGYVIDGDLLLAGELQALANEALDEDREVAGGVRIRPSDE